MRLHWMVLVLATAGCAGSKPAERTDRERDSIVAQSRLPGAPAVRATLKVSDSLAARTGRLDSVAQ